MATSDIIIRIRSDERGFSTELTTAQLNRLSQQAHTTQETLKSLPIVLAGVGTVTTGLANTTMDVLALHKELLATSTAFNVSTQSIQVWAAAARPLGIEADKMSDIFKDVNDKLGDLATTGGGEAKDLFEQLKLKIQDFKSLAPDQALLKIGEALNKSKLTQSQKIFLLEGLADDASRLLPLLQTNGAALASIRRELTQSGALLDAQDLKTLKDANEAASKLQNAWAGVKTEAGLAGAALLVAAQPKITSVVNTLRDNTEALSLLSTLLVGRGVAALTAYTSAKVSDIAASHLQAAANRAQGVAAQQAAVTTAQAATVETAAQLNKAQARVVDTAATARQMTGMPGSDSLRFGGGTRHRRLCCHCSSSIHGAGCRSAGGTGRRDGAC